MQATTIHGVAKSRARLSNFTFFHFPVLLAGKSRPCCTLIHCPQSHSTHSLSHIYLGLGSISQIKLDNSNISEVKVKSLSRARLFTTPWIVACTKLLRPWDFQGKSTAVGCHFLLQGIFPTQGSNPGLSHCRQTLYHLSHQGSLGILRWKKRSGESQRDGAQ